MDANIEQSNTVIKLRVAFMYWLICLAILILCFLIGGYFNIQSLGTVGFIFYLCAGIYLSKKVLANLIEWHQMYNTLDNVTSDKLKYLALWPVMYPILFMKLGVQKIL
ncbi:MAG: hypothetical protein Q8J66_00930 [Methylotenera sp.]|nr:hypothetical protein [Methylotenera sp.]